MEVILGPSFWCEVTLRKMGRDPEGQHGSTACRVGGFDPFPLVERVGTPSFQNPWN